jgi:hypothetical protein
MVSETTDPIFFFEVVLYRPGLLASSSRCEVASDTSRPLPPFFRVETSHTRSTLTPTIYFLHYHGHFRAHVVVSRMVFFSRRSARPAGTRPVLGPVDPLNRAPS